MSKKKYELELSKAKESAYDEARRLNKTDVRSAAAVSAVGTGVVVSAVLGLTTRKKIKSLESSCIVAERAVNRSFSRMVTLVYSDDEELKNAVQDEVRQMIAQSKCENKERYITENIQATASDLCRAIETASKYIK